MQCHKGTSSAGCPSRAWTPVPFSLKWSLSGTQYPDQSNYSCALEHRVQKQFPLERKQVPVQYAEPYLSGALLAPSLGSSCFLQVLLANCVPVLSLGTEQSAYLPVAHYSHLVASVELYPE